MLIAIIVLLALLQYMAYKPLTMKCSVKYPEQPLHKYHQNGDFILGGIASHGLFLSYAKDFTKKPLPPLPEEILPMNYQHILALAFAVKEINENPQILPNITLGFHIYNNYYNAKWTFHSTMLLTYTLERFFPNYNCNMKKKLLAVIGGLDSLTSLDMAIFLDIYKIPQLTYSPTTVMKDKSPGLPFYQMVPREDLQYEGILSLLLYFRWIWIGVVVMDTESGERFVQTVIPMFSQKGVCFAFIQKIPIPTFITNMSWMLKQGNIIYDTLRDNNKVKVILAYSESHSLGFFRFLSYLSDEEVESKHKNPLGKVWITTAQMELTSFGFQRDWDLDIFHGAIAFTFHSNHIPGFHEFIENQTPSGVTGDGFIKTFWEKTFGCLFPDTVSLSPPSFEMDMSGHSYSIYNAVYAIAHAFQNMMTSGIRVMVDGGLQLHKQSFWQTRPVSLCTPSCYPGSRKQVMDGEPFCCYTCMSYLDKTFSITDMNHCYSCTKEKYPSKNQDSCIPKDISFLSYKEPLGISLACFSLLCSTITILILRIFMIHHNSPIVKASNQNLTYMLLITLLLCFLCALLFIGQPNKVACILRQTTFSIIFSVAISCVLAKTVTVVLAFVATKPGSGIKKWVGKKLGYTFVLTGFLIQVGICTVWLSISPPIPNPDLYSETENIVLQCKEGSIIMFYCAKCYMGLLAMISFIVAFFARNLPDTFNEARFITFSMLVFCSVWISFIPTYLSTKGKYMVAVEIFSMLASSAGLLICIFFPKCYIIVLRPDLNNRQLRRQRK
uniref:G-protein coupled receptors family 3 profile domain-containing protein n=1 Tax=Pseudonaja textilis TaxID=8673 RepID=A0A670ZQ39_PSETE